MSLWSDDDIDFAIEALRLVSTPAEALAAISEHIGRAVTADGLRNVFGRRKMGAPSSYCGGPEGPAFVASAEVVTEAASTTKVLILPDSHHPFNDKKAWSLVLDVARGWKPDTIVLLGDLADFYAVSFHPKSPARKANLEHEVAAVNEALDQIDALGARRKVFCAGNHERRLERYLAQNAPALWGMMNLQQIFRIKERGGWEWVEYMQHTRVGNTFFTHDFGDCGMNAHNTARQTMGAPVVIGHTHRLSMSYVTRADGEVISGAMFGHLLDLESVDYLSRGKAGNWTLGFGIGHITTDGRMHTHGVPIMNYRAVVDGVVYEG